MKLWIYLVIVIVTGLLMSALGLVPFTADITLIAMILILILMERHQHE